MIPSVTFDQESKLLKMCSDAEARFKANGTETAVYLDSHGSLNEEINPAEDFGREFRSPIFTICFYNASFPLGVDGLGQQLKNPVAALECAMEERNRFYAEREKEYEAAAWPSAS
jgi:hypothetical protein